MERKEPVCVLSACVTLWGTVSPLGPAVLLWMVDTIVDASEWLCGPGGVLIWLQAAAGCGYRMIH